MDLDPYRFGAFFNENLRQESGAREVGEADGLQVYHPRRPGFLSRLFSALAGQRKSSFSVPPVSNQEKPYVLRD